MIGYDYTERIAPAALKAAGCSVVSRYVTRLDWPKSLQRAEANELRAAGMPVMCNFESTADRMKGGAAAGRADAIEALQHLAVLGAPADVTVWFSADWDVQPGEIPAVLAYLNAAASVLGGNRYVGCYGGLRAVKAAADAGFGIWQTVAWSGGQWDPRAVARQTGRQLIVGGVQVDENEIINVGALGAWGGPTTGGVIDVTPEEHNWLTNLYSGMFLGGSSCGSNTPAGKNGLFAHVEYITSMLQDLTGRPATPPPTPPVDVAALAKAVTDAVVAVIEPAVMAAIPPAQADVEAAIAAAVVAHLGIQVVAK